MSGRKVYFGVNALDPKMAPVASETKQGLARRFGVSIKTIDRMVAGEKVAEWWFISVPVGGKTEFWRVCEIEVVRSKVKGNVENFKGFRGYRSGGKMEGKEV